MIQRSSIDGFVLAGGDSHRLGLDKRRLRVAGETLLERSRRLIVELLGVEPLVVGDNLDELGLAAGSTIGDAVPGSGPLGGLVAALERCTSEWALVLAADLPRMSVVELKRLIEEAGEDREVVTLTADGRPEPLAALYRKSTSLFWKKRLDDGDLSLQQGIRRLKWRAVPSMEAGALFNVNEPADLDRLDGGTAPGQGDERGSGGGGEG